ncbi:AzlD domain-containing protein [Eggerthellaceae bacterium zg-1084]|uniref:AzlD domain-containing protein n=1 Tax=Berryella wangjianweii TaxID=2734634 RepID=A0A6M8J4A9_9ACTN|nr:AzlD domain-containing protein [Berryella wangjianweii]NPD31267.1 AzlD domain-containing protein [Berryella wangjianweii]NPD32424.1 AzlD domain-containing protein [Eggerthellaceae bacterium zg-997]QKF06816.1 AzlD domain-containing protein [Berryella wangjianweii]
MTESIQWSDFWILLGITATTMLACRVLPLMLLAGRNLAPRVTEALGYIPPAAFAALVANDLFTPGMFDAGLWPAALPLVAGLVVVAVARLTGSLVWCAVAGIAAYGLLMMA